MQGWDEVAQIGYETGAEERRMVVGAARRKGNTYNVTLIDDPTFRLATAGPTTIINADSGA